MHIGGWNKKIQPERGKEGGRAWGLMYYADKKPQILTFEILLPVQHEY